jgi:4-amino-4-deoxy-L-arabinose transferase-like glycosyltransferase
MACLRLAVSALRKWRLACLIALFLCALAPYAATYLTCYPDEPHYTDAALLMLANGDWLTPLQADGQPRFNKPGLTYWLVAGSFRVFGVSALAGRLPFLLAGALTGWLTHRLALRLTASRTAAWLAALIALSHPVLMLSAVRTMPDVLLCFFMLVSASGFLRLIVLGEQRLGNYLAAYGGAGLAAASKGLLPMVFVVYAWVFVLLRQPKDCRWKSLIHVPAMLAGAVVGGGWFVLMSLLHGSRWLGEFWGDQVTPIFSGGSAGFLPSLLLRAVVFCSFYFVTFLPWSAVAATVAWKSKPPLAPAASLRRAAWFILPWCLVLPLLFGLGHNLSIRYLLPAAPLAAILLGDYLSRAGGQVAQAHAARCFHLLAGLAALAGLVLAGLVFAAGSPGFGFATVGLYLFVLFGLGWLVTRRQLSSFAGLGCLPLLAVLAGFLFFRWVFLPDVATQIACRIRASGLGAGQSVALVGPPRLAARVRVALGGKVRVQPVDSLQAAAKSQSAGLVLPAAESLKLPATWANSRLLVHGFAEAPKLDWTRVTSPRALVSLLESCKQTYVVVLPQPSLAGKRSFPGN